MRKADVETPKMICEIFGAPVHEVCTSMKLACDARDEDRYIHALLIETRCPAFSKFRRRFEVRNTVRRLTRAYRASNSNISIVLSITAF